MSACNSCDGGCGGCDRSLTLTPPEIRILLALAQVPFLPVARTREDPAPVYLEDRAFPSEVYALALSLLEKKALIDLDYDRPLAGADYGPYDAWPVRGSMALTARGQAVVDLLQIQGAAEEA